MAKGLSKGTEDPGGVSPSGKLGRRATAVGLVLILVVVALLVYALIPPHLQVGRRHNLIVSLQNQMEFEISVSVIVDGTAVNPIHLGSEETRPIGIDGAFTDSVHVVQVSSPLHPAKTVTTRVGMGILFQFFLDGTVAYSFFDVP